MRALTNEPGRVFSIRELLEDVWQDSTASAPSRVKHAVRRLRAKLADHGVSPDAIQAVRGFGYRYEPPRSGEVVQVDRVAADHGVRSSSGTPAIDSSITRRLYGQS